MATGCVNLIDNKVRRVQSALGLAWQRSAATMQQEAAFRKGAAPPLPIWSPELLGLIGDAWPLDLRQPSCPTDLHPGAPPNPDGPVGARPYDEFAALPEEGGASDESGAASGALGGGSLDRDLHPTLPGECPWIKVASTSRIQRTRWLHGLVLDPHELSAAKLRADDSFSEGVARSRRPLSAASLCYGVSAHRLSMADRGE